MNIKPILHLKAKVKQSYTSFLGLFKGGGWISNPFIAWFGISLTLVPFFFVLVLGVFLSSRSENNEIQLAKLEEKARFLVKQKKDRSRFYQEYGTSDKDFILNYVCTEKLLSGDIQLLNELEKSSEYSSYQPIKDRIHFLTDGANQINFEEKSSVAGDFYTEKLYGLSNKVELNCHDVSKMLSLVEGVIINKFLPNPLRPHLTITNFDLTLIPQDNTNKVFSLDMEILQRGCHAELHS